MCHHFQEVFLNASNWVKHPLQYTLQPYRSVFPRKTFLSPLPPPHPSLCTRCFPWLECFSHLLFSDSAQTSPLPGSLLRLLGSLAILQQAPEHPVQSSPLILGFYEAAVLSSGWVGNHVFSSTTYHRTVDCGAGGGAMCQGIMTRGG